MGNEKDGHTSTEEQNKKEMSKEFRKMLDKRDNLVRSIMHHDEIMKRGNVSQTMTASRLSAIEGSFKKYASIMEKIIEHDDYEYDLLEVDNETVTDAYFSAIEAMKKVAKEDLDGSKSLSSTMAARSSACQAIKLPTQNHLIGSHFMIHSRH